MNIFLLDRDPKTNARFHVDKHVNKMILEHAQMLSTAVRESGIDAGYRATHKNHPCTKWVMESLSNWRYLVELTEHLHTEWKYRFDHIDKNHKSMEVIRSLPEPNIPDRGLTEFAQAMPDEFKQDDPVQAYRTYYKESKRHLFYWTDRTRPEWIV